MRGVASVPAAVRRAASASTVSSAAQPGSPVKATAKGWNSSARWPLRCACACSAAIISSHICSAVRLGIAAVALAQPGELRQERVGIHELPAERQHSEAVERPLALAGGGDVAVAALGEQRERASCQPTARGPKAAWLQADRAHGLGRAVEQRRLRGGIQRGPLLVAPGVHRDLVARLRQIAQRVGVHLGVEPLDEERRPRASSGEQLQQPGSTSSTVKCSPWARLRATCPAATGRPRRDCRTSPTRRRPLAPHALMA